ncbi:hypothetical protein BCR37DRAFT_380690 [Protomyces lactucae-debilis]|uniref:RING-CH-type domain-containing protein n=1 Tax=Protomyces lactucae-debilis TaxID=2754530 RepID=A0A1Y2FBZ0_PROLT|nr:uncharacterized protein BCR37DRAFT_380690 [Protomyces lactucae-debilis]ORY80846.1 hypothetical protein BCR37DRAFT_380690 [Protomyces lactucae-debilis]
MDTQDIRQLRARRYKSAAVHNDAQESVAGTSARPNQTFNFKSGVVKDEADEVLSKYTTLQDTDDEEGDAGNLPQWENLEEEAPSSAYPAFKPQREDLRPASRQTTKPATAASAAEAPAAEEEERLCRICFSPQTPDERLISPCKCKGSAKWIHETCLNQWRIASQNRRSFYQCDQCLYKYSFYRTDVANWLSAPSTVFLFTALAFLFAMFIGGFVVKFGLWLYPPGSMLYHSTSWLSGWFYTPFDAGTDLLNAASALVPIVPRKFSDIFVVDIWHFVQGLVSLGVIGVLGFMGSGGFFTMRLFNPRRRRGENGRASIGLGELALILVLFAGCAKIAVSLWRIVGDIVTRRLQGASQRIREVHD